MAIKYFPIEETSTYPKLSITVVPTSTTLPYSLRIMLSDTESFPVDFIVASDNTVEIPILSYTLTQDGNVKLAGFSTAGDRTGIIRTYENLDTFDATVTGTYAY